MELSAAVASRPVLVRFHGAACSSDSSPSLSTLYLRPRNFSGFDLSSGIAVSGQLQGYVSPRAMGKEREKKKDKEKNLTLKKWLAKDLATFSDMVSGVQNGNCSVDEEDERKMMKVRIPTIFLLSSSCFFHECNGTESTCDLLQCRKQQRSCLDNLKR